MHFQFHGPKDGPVLALLTVIILVAAFKADTSVVDYVCLGALVWLIIRQSRS